MSMIEHSEDNLWDKKICSCQGWEKEEMDRWSIVEFYAGTTLHGTVISLYRCQNS
jgi:hypothetical protein